MLVNFFADLGQFFRRVVSKTSHYLVKLYAVFTQVLVACAEQHQYGANEFRDMANLLDTARMESDKAIQEAADVPLSDDARAKIAGIHPAVRSLDVYTDLIEGEINGRK